MLYTYYSISMSYSDLFIPIETLNPVSTNVAFLLLNMDIMKC